MNAIPAEKPKDDEEEVKRDQVLWQKLKDTIGLRNHNALASNITHAQFRQQEKECGFEVGTVSAHTYSVHELVEFTSDGSVVQLLKMANTRGATKQWKGDWSRESNLWTEELKAAHLNNLPKDEFYMPFPEYLKWFRGTIVSFDQQLLKTRDQYTISNIGTDMHDKKEAFVEFTLKRSIDCEKDVFAVICEQQGKKMQFSR